MSLPFEWPESSPSAAAPAPALSEAFLQAMVAEMDSDEVTAIILAGSYVRGKATRYSDVDFARMVREPSQAKKKRYFYRDDRLISVVTWPLAFLEESITRPEIAIWRVPALREARILLDKEGAFGAFQQRLADFRWDAIQARADAWASDELLLYTEFAHKTLGTLLRRDETALAYVAQEMVYILTWVMAVQRGVLVEGGNAYYRQVQEAAGADSAWTRYHRLILCLEPFRAHLSPAEARGIAAIHLYEETVRLLRNALLLEDRVVIEQTLRVIEQAALPDL